MSRNADDSGTSREENGRWRLIIQILVDLILLLAVGVPVIVSYNGGISPFQRGFFCDDNSIKYPYVDDTISDAVLMGVGFTLAFVMVIIVEVPRYMSSKLPMAKSRELVICVKSCCVVLLGFAISMGFVQAIKYSVGALRPHFLDVCKPDFSSVNCSLGYITQFTCTETKFSASILRRSRTSFPSGHAAFSMYIAVYLSLYFEVRCAFWFSRSLKPLLQASLFLFSVLVSVTRVQDHKHHPHDVIAGSILGIVIGLFVFKTLGEKAARSREINLFVPFLRKQDSVSEPRTPTPLLQHDRTSFLRLESQKSECNGNYSFAKSTPSPLITNEIEGRDGLPV
uniref:Phospholipid phosphatase 3-like n=1 Tax=Crassostrea virginica TaxID=6565 RepID=A0A8B8CTT0_CRAVI|nr:phospholipid phosphatase 3-like [Crassostrea virginica]XP_022319116.1 phospholipid phosphatase 3-like [Crassostrea virginica]